MKIDELINEPYVRVLCYPEPDLKISRKRIEELKNLEVKGILFEGRTKIGRLGVAGKGCVSIVVKAVTEFGVSALKIRRMDANRDSMAREAEMQLMANSVGVGPELFGVTENFSLMEFIDGYSILDWLKSIEKQDIRRIRTVLRDILDQCYALDKLGLDHGELSNLKKHIIVSEKPVMIDFESASMNRRVANVTKATQYLFIGGPMAKRLRGVLGIKDEKSIIDSIKNYKEKKDEAAYLKLLSSLRLVG
ncbi:MAG: serine/threonine protein kinase [archaeon]|nr:serine/threonine protein kinase [archaeon]